MRIRSFMCSPRSSSCDIYSSASRQSTSARQSGTSREILGASVPLWQSPAPPHRAMMRFSTRPGGPILRAGVASAMDVQNYKDALLRKRGEILGAGGIKPLQASMENNTRQGDMADQASGNNEVHIQLKLKQTDAKILQAIEEALWRIEKGTYGVCRDCGEPIAPARLNAIPRYSGPAASSRCRPRWKTTPVRATWRIRRAATTKSTFSSS